MMGCRDPGEAGRDSREKFDDRVIEQGNATLKPVRHAHPILDMQERWQQGLTVEMQHLIEIGTVVDVIGIVEDRREILPGLLLVEHRKDADMKTYIDFAWGKRPGEELYDLRKDPHQMKNLAEDTAYRETLDSLRRQLMDELTAKKDPRVVDDDAFDRPPYMTRRQ